MIVDNTTMQVATACLHTATLLILTPSFSKFLPKGDKLALLFHRAEYWQELHDTIRITIHVSRYDYITLYCNTMHIAMHCSIPQSSLKM